MKQLPIKLSLTLVSLATAFGVFIHDTSLDSALKVTGAHLYGHHDASHANDHTHPNSVLKSLIHGFSYNSGIPPRDEKDKKYVSRHQPGGRHAFDSSFLPVID